MRLFSVLFSLSAFVSGCSTGQIIEKKEYEFSASALKMDSPSIALKKFPKKETKHFIPLLEKVYLQLIDEANVITPDSKDTYEFSELLRQSREIIQNEKTSISNELGQLFFIQTDEGYYPANHEVFWMHLLLGLTFVKKNKIASARVEAKRISDLFARVDINGKTFYDNAGIRILAASLWLMCDERENALVDLRKAQALGEFSFTDRIESRLMDWEVVFKGTGFIATTDGKTFSEKLSGFQAIRFHSDIVEKPENEKYRPTRFVYSSQKWHEDNLVRNEAFKEIIQKSKYMSRVFSSELEYQSLNVLTSAATGMVLVTGVTVGLAIVGGGIYLASQTGGSGEAVGQIIGIGLIAGTQIFSAGMSFYESAQSRIQKEKRDFQDVSRFYRYVRFIPDYFILETDPALLGKKQGYFLRSENAAGKVKLRFEP